MMPFKRTHDDACTTPILDRSIRSSFWPAFLKVVAVVAISYAAIANYGLPALKYDYVYRGRHEHRVELSCRYLTFDGWKRVIPPVGADHCPIIAFFPTSILPFSR